MAKFKINWYKEYTVTGTIEVEAKDMTAAENEVDEKLGDLEGSKQLTDYGISSVEKLD
jgi:hypothetical protein